MKNRIHMGNGGSIGRAKYQEWKLGNQFSEAIAHTRHCLKIRNQYAHCLWHDDQSGRLGFVQLEEIAFENRTIDLDALTTKYLDLDVLTQQEVFFRFVLDCLRYLNFEGRNRAGRSTTQPWSDPIRVERPPLCIP